MTNAIQNRSRKVPPPRRAEAESAAQHSADPALRKTGIPVMGDMPWGAHLCVFFETKTDLLDTAATYFAAGLASNHGSGIGPGDINAVSMKTFP